jgi:hypothetical protein
MTYLRDGTLSIKMLTSSDTLDHWVGEAALEHNLNVTGSEGFAVTKFPSYMQHFCHHPHNKGDPICPTWRRRAKVMVKTFHSSDH